MSTVPTNPALEAAIVANADEDTPRLAYADWLDENGDPDRAAFIRVQCRLADLSPAEADWVGLIEQQDELVARLKSRYLGLGLDKPNRFYIGTAIINRHEEPFRRGFPYFMGCQVSGAEWTPKETARVIADLTRLVDTTTIRGFQPYSLPNDRLAELLDAPVVARLTGLSLQPHATTQAWEAEITAFHRLVATSPAIRGVRQLSLYSGVTPAGTVALAKATTFGAVRRMTIQGFNATKKELDQLTSADWFGRLRHFRSHLSSAPVAHAAVAGLGQLPDLHTLDLPGLWGPAVQELAVGSFPSLARLIYHGSGDREAMTALARAKFPALAVFEAQCGIKNDAFFELLKGDWPGRLRCLDLTGNSLGDRAVAALAAHDAAKHLGVLRLGDNAFGKGGLAALAKPGAFPQLTTLDLRSYHKRKSSEADVVKFIATLQLPGLKHLDLRGWPLGDAGAKALAASPASANLTRLDLSSCEIGDAGAKALFASPHLQNLVELQLSDNAITTGADTLADPAVMPRLGECWLTSNKLSPKSSEAIRRDGLYVII